MTEVTIVGLDAQDADKRISEIAALFIFLNERHDILSGCSHELPTSDMLLRAA